jgi:cell division protein FtsB
VRLRRAAWPVLASVAVVGVLFAGVFPTRTYLAQRASISHAEKQIEVLGKQNDELEARAEKLRTDAEIERLARENYNLVKPGEEAYALLPPPSSGSTTTTVPATQAEHREGDDRNFAEKAWDGITGIF